MKMIIFTNFMTMNFVPDILKKIFYDDVKQEDINLKNLKYLRKEDF